MRGRIGHSRPPLSWRLGNFSCSIQCNYQTQTGQFSRKAHMRGSQVCQWVNLLTGLPEHYAQLKEPQLATRSLQEYYSFSFVSAAQQVGRPVSYFPRYQFGLNNLFNPYNDWIKQNLECITYKAQFVYILCNVVLVGQRYLLVVIKRFPGQTLWKEFEARHCIPLIVGWFSTDEAPLVGALNKELALNKGWSSYDGSRRIWREMDAAPLLLTRPIGTAFSALLLLVREVYRIPPLPSGKNLLVGLRTFVCLFWPQHKLFSIRVGKNRECNLNMRLATGMLLVLAVLVLMFDDAKAICNALQKQVNLTMCNWQGLRGMWCLHAICLSLFPSDYYLVIQRPWFHIS